jgi:hypothetical protein
MAYGIAEYIPAALSL